MDFPVVEPEEETIIPVEKKEDAVVYLKDKIDLHQSFFFLFSIIFFVVIIGSLIIYIISIVVNKCFFLHRVQKVGTYSILNLSHAGVWTRGWVVFCARI